MKKKALTSLGIVVILAAGVFFVVRFYPLHNSGEGGSPSGEPGEVVTNEHLPVSASLQLENGEKINLRVADSPDERQLGLSYFKSLPQDEGMLFLFDKLGTYPFWMKDMNFPLDIIWLKKTKNDTYEIVFVAHDVSPKSYPQNINPYVSSDTVLEINSGLASVYNLNVKKVLGITFKK